MKKIVAVVPIRKGSQRVKNKNFKSFCGKNLLIHKIIALKKVKNIDEIIINTDSEKAISIAKKFKVSYFKREKYFASSKCTNSEFWSNVASTTKSKYILFTHCTSPLISHKTYENSIKSFFLNKKKFNSLNSVSDVKEFLFLKNKPVNFKLDKAPNSQNLPNIIKLNFAISILETDYMKTKKTLIGNRPFFYKLNQIEGHDINTKYEFEFAKYLFKNKN
tara:strand:+ start:3395 stop:4051 length:657 start_codon:yes stop_codon:yes gene_type:complete